MDVKVANTKAPLWARISKARDARPELSKLRMELSKNKAVSEALEEFLYSHYHYLLSQQRFESDSNIREMDVATANAIATVAQLIFEDEQKQQNSPATPGPKF